MSYMSVVQCSVSTVGYLLVNWTYASTIAETKLSFCSQTGIMLLDSITPVLQAIQSMKQQDLNSVNALTNVHAGRRNDDMNNQQYQHNKSQNGTPVMNVSTGSVHDNSHINSKSMYVAIPVNATVSSNNKMSFTFDVNNSGTKSNVNNINRKSGGQVDFDSWINNDTNNNSFSNNRAGGSNNSGVLDALAKSAKAEGNVDSVCYDLFYCR